MHSKQFMKQMEIVLSVYKQKAIWKFVVVLGFIFLGGGVVFLVALTVLLPNVLLVHLLTLGKLAALESRLSKSVFLFPDFVVVTSVKK